MINKTKLASLMLASTIVCGAFSASAFEGPRINTAVNKISVLGFMPNTKTKWGFNSSASTYNGRIKMQNQAGLEISSSYFFAENMSAEAALGFVPYRAKYSRGTLNLVDQYDTAGTFAHKHSRLFIIPVTLTAKLHTDPIGGASPYVGAGVHYTFMNSKKADVKFRDSRGGVVQAGLNFNSNDKMGFNLDAKYYLMKSNMKLNLTDGVKAAKQSINPLVLSAGVTFRM